VGSKWTLAGDRDADTSFALNAFVETPTGDDDLPAGDETGFGVGLDWRASNWLLNIGYHDTGDDDLGEEVLAGAGYLGSISDQFFWITEILAAIQTGDSDIKDSYDLTSGGRYWLGPDSDWALNFGLRLDLNQLSDLDEHCPIGGLLGLTYRPRTHIPPPPPEPPPAPAPVPPPPPPPPAPEPVAPPPAPAPKPEQRETINFGPGSARLSNVAKAKLDEVALQLKQDPGATAEVIGYSDNAGSEAANQAISEARAKAAMDYLVTRHGIDPSRITAHGMGSADPVAANDSAEGRAMNRRAVIIVRGQ
jgi:outer membrane protein OmpA-like peptidoglycan-associated protein